MLQLIRLILLTVILTLTYTSVLQAKTIPVQSHIAIISAIGNSANINQYGAFQNTNKAFTLNDFAIDGTLTSIAKHTLNELGYQNVTVIQLPQNNLIISLGDNIFHTGFSSVDLTPEVKQYISNSITDKNINYVILLTPGYACPINGKCDLDVVPRFGVANVSLLGSKTYFYNALEANLLDGNNLNILETQTQTGISEITQNVDPDYLASWLNSSYQNITPTVLLNIKSFNPDST